MYKFDVPGASRLGMRKASSALVAGEGAYRVGNLLGTIFGPIGRSLMPFSMVDLQRFDADL